MHDILNCGEVAISTGEGRYPCEAPYSPAICYPEYPFGTGRLTSGASRSYEGIREALALLGLDASRYGRPEWNPLGELICPGDTVVLKPNFVRHFRDTRRGHENCLTTHGSVIRAALDYVYIALKGEGRIIIADAPQDDADFEVIRRMTGLEDIQAFYDRHAGFEVEVCDLRPQQAQKVAGVICGHRRLPGDPAGYVKVDLGRHSMFCEVERFSHLLYGSEYDTREIQSHHCGGVHEYLISRTIMDADCVINLPKLKTHKKTGVTICMKNLVGINGNKNWLPHHRLGAPCHGGDQFTDDGVIHRLERGTMSCFRGIFPLLGPLRILMARPLKAVGQVVFGDTNKSTIRSGNWHGNDTTWRMAIDLNRILMHFGGSGQPTESPCRPMLSLVDGIVAGEGNGPTDPTPKSAGMIVAGINPVAVDLVCARLMGFDYRLIPLLYRALEENCPLAMTLFGYQAINCISNAPEFNRPLFEFQRQGECFRPHFGWQGHIELDRPPGMKSVNSRLKPQLSRR